MSRPLEQIVVVALVLALFAIATAAKSTQEVYAFLLCGEANPWLLEDVEGILEKWEKGAFQASVEKMETGLHDGWNVDVDHIQPYYAQDHTRTEFYNELEAFLAPVDKDDIVIFYYVGHGGRGCMDPNFNGSPRLVSYKKLNLYLESKARETVVILDACHSGSAEKSLDRDMWLISSCAAHETKPSGPPLFSASPFTIALADAMLQGKTGVRETFAAANYSWAGFWAGLGPSPQLFYPREEDLIVNNRFEREIIFPSGTTITISGSFVGAAQQVPNHVALQGTVQNSIKVRINGKSVSMNATLTFTFTGYPDEGRAEGELEISASGSIPGVGPVTIHVHTWEEGRVMFTSYPIAQGLGCGGDFSGWLEVDGQRVEIAGEGECCAQTWGTGPGDITASIDYFTLTGTFAEPLYRR